VGGVGADAVGDLDRFDGARWQRTPACACRVGGQAQQDAEQPGANGSFAAERVEAAARAEQGLLREVFGGVVVAPAAPPREGQERGDVPAQQGMQGAGVSGAGSRERGSFFRVVEMGLRRGRHAHAG
jgi:hypothetical protein